MIARKRLRAPMHAAAAAFLGAALGYAAMHVVDYERFRARACCTRTTRRTRPRPPATPKSTTRSSAQTGHGGFIGYLLLAADEGVAITNVGHGGGIHFRGKAAWGLWLAELLFSAGCAGLLARARAAHPFCERCGVWFADTG